MRSGSGVLVEQAADLGGAVGRGHHDDEGDGAGRGHRAYGVDQHGRAAQRAQRLGGARTEPYAAAGGRNHRGGAVGREGSDIEVRRRGVGHRFAVRFVSSADVGMAYSVPGATP